MSTYYAHLFNSVPKGKYAYFCFFHVSKHCWKILWNCSNVQILGMTLTNQNCIHEDTEIRPNLEKVCYHAVHSLLSSCLLPKNEKIKIYKTIIPHVVFYKCETWSLTLRKEHRERPLWTGCLGQYSDQTRIMWQDAGKNCTIRSSFVLFIKYY